MMNAFPIEILHVVVATIGVMLALATVRDGVLTMTALVRTGQRDSRDRDIALERLFTALFVLAAQIYMATVAYIAVFSAPPPPGIESLQPTPFRASYFMMLTSNIAVSLILTVKSWVRLWYRRKLNEERST